MEKEAHEKVETQEKEDETKGPLKNGFRVTTYRQLTSSRIRETARNVVIN